MLKLIVGVVLAIVGVSAEAAPPSKVNFGIDCMIHDQYGRRVSDLGMLGAMMDESYSDRGSFAYSSYSIAASLAGPFAEAPEVASPQLKLTVTDRLGNILANVVTTANPEMNVLLFIPSAGVFLHCDKMAAM